jgi:cobalt-precorrin-5B (C1)-methyltransferase
VVPYSCSAWIHTIHRGIDVARAEGLDHVAGATGSTSESAVQALHGLPDHALIDMGDFAGGMLKYLRGHPVPRVTVAGGFAKMTKLAQGRLDLHSRAGAVDLDWLADRLAEAGADRDVVAASRGANTALEVLRTAETLRLPLADIVAQHAWRTAAKALRGAEDRPRDRGLRPRRPAGRAGAVPSGVLRTIPGSRRAGAVPSRILAL